MQKYILPFIILALSSSTAMAQLRVEHFVRVNGLEPTEITGYGIVSGLSGTGDDPRGYTPFVRAKLTQLARSGMFGADEAGMRGARNSALVRVTVTIPGTGARRGDELDATIVSEGNASSLAGGVLTVTHLSHGHQQDENALPLGEASGRVTIESAASPNVGRIIRGCRLLANFNRQFIEDGLITLTIHPQHARPVMANRIAEAINNDSEFDMQGIQPARAMGANRVVVRVPPTEFHDPMGFLERILDAELLDVPAPMPRVVINERTGTIVISENVRVRPTAVTHGGFVAEVRPELGPGEEMEEFPHQFIAMDSDTMSRRMNGENVVNPTLRTVQAMLNAMQATPQEIIDVIRALNDIGAIIGEVIFVD